MGVAGTWAKIGGLGAKVANLACPADSSVVRNMQAVSKYGKANDAAWAHLARVRGDVEIIREELLRRNRARLDQFVKGQKSEFV